jgi:steroid 5-alpha reductase family enzyme
MQKTMFLEWRQWAKKHASENGKTAPMPNILSNKLWQRTRNPNYFGELLIYSSFTLLALHWLPIFWLAMMITIYWLPSMR